MNLALWGVDMLFKYYTYNVILDGAGLVGSRAVRVLFFRSPLFAMRLVLNQLEANKAITDFRRIR
jgi:hypothetical protein